jgi:hypothetical protein
LRGILAGDHPAFASEATREGKSATSRGLLSGARTPGLGIVEDKNILACEIFRTADAAKGRAHYFHIMIELSRAEFQQYPVSHGPNLIRELYGVEPTTERFWFKHGDRLGIVLFDNVDSDWSLVALSKDAAGVYRAFDVSCSYPDAAAAKRALEGVLAKAALEDTPAQ